MLADRYLAVSREIKENGMVTRIIAADHLQAVLTKLAENMDP